MILGVDKLLALVKEKKLVENLCDRELNNPEGAGFDIRIGEVYEINGDGLLGIEEKQTPKETLVAKYTEGEKNVFEFLPGKYYLMKTIEKVNTPSDIAILFRSRSTLYRSGIALFTGNVSPGYCGELTFGIANLGLCPIKIEMGARVAHAMFYQVDGQTCLYRGQWQGGKVATKDIEKQV